MSRIAFVLSQFPEMHETFILRELSEFDRQGIEFSIYSLKSCRDPIVHPEAKSLLPLTRYSRFLFSRRVLLAQVRCLLGRPRAYFGALRILLRHGWGNRLALAKSLAVFPKAVRFATDMERQGVTHIHAHWATVPTSVAMAMSRLTGISFSFTAHAWDIYVDNPTLVEKMHRASFVVTCTRHNREYLESLPIDGHSADVVLNYHGIDLSLFSPSQPPTGPRYRILSIGRLVEQKGFEWLIRAVAFVRDSGRRVQCTIVGLGPDRGVLEALVEELELGDSVQFADAMSLEKVRELYRSSHLFVLPSVVAGNSDRDGIPNVIIEAMAMGLPVVSSSISGIPELVVHEETGLLAAERDFESIAANMIRLLEQDELWEKTRAQGRERVEMMFDVNRNVSELISHFRRFGVIE